MKYYNYLQKAMAIKDGYSKTMGELKDEAATIEERFNKGFEAKVTYEERIKANEAAMLHIRDERINDIDGVISDFNEFVGYVKTPSGERLTSDSALFNGLVTLTEDDLREIADRNKYNLTMTNIVTTYAKRNGVTLMESMVNNFAKLTADYDRMLKAVKDYITDETGTGYMSRYVETGRLENTLEQEAAYYADLDNYAKAAGITAE